MGKTGLDYFSLDCYMNDKVKLIQAEFGLRGFAVVVKLFQKIYGERGYYCEWNDEVLLLFMVEQGVTSDSKNLIRDIVAACIRRDIFSRDLYEKYGILTSPGIQTRYLSASKRRGQIEMKKEYLLISVPENIKNVDIKPIFVYKSEKNVCRNSQSKVKESKVKESKEYIAPSASGKDTRTLKHSYGQYQNVLLTEEEYQRLADKYTSSVRDEAIEFLDMYIAEKGYKSKSHNLAIQRWVIDAVKERKAKTKSKAGFNTFEQSNNDLDEIERLLLEEVNTHG